MKPRHAHGAELEAYFVYSQPVLPEQLRLSLPEVRLELFPHQDSGLVRAVRLTGDVEPALALEVLRHLLQSQVVRWLEFGFRGYSLIDNKREYRPWRRNAHLSAEQLAQLGALEPEVRYHAPV